MASTPKRISDKIDESARSATFRDDNNASLRIVFRIISGLLYTAINVFVLIVIVKKIGIDLLPFSGVQISFKNTFFMPLPPVS